MPRRLRASRCPRCRRLVAPPASICPRPSGADGADASLPASARWCRSPRCTRRPRASGSPLHIALVELEGGARLFCHGADTEGVKIGSHVSVEAVDSVYYFSHMGFTDRARLFWRRAGASGERVGAIGKSVVKGVWNRRPRGED